MTEVQQPPTGSVASFVVVGAVLVAFTTPLNLILLLFCWSLVAETAGSYTADNSGSGVVLLGGVVNVGLFLALCGLSELSFRRSSLLRRQVAVAVVLVLHLGIWLGGSFALVAHMAATGVWL